MFKRQTCCGAVLLGIASMAFSASAAMAQTAQAWPSRPITMVVPFGVGSALDLMGRVIGSRMAELLGQSVVIE